METVDIVKFDYESLPAYQGARERQEQLVLAHPFVEIEDTKTYDLAKKNRTALRKGRTDLQNGEKTIASKLKNFRDTVKDKTLELIAITKNAEEKQQTEIDRYEAILAEKKAEKERIENERIEGIRNKIIDFRNEFSKRIANAAYVAIDGKSEAIADVEIAMEAVDFDCEEFSQDFDLVKESLSEQLSEKKDQLNEAERMRKENERIESEKKKMELERSRYNELLKYKAPIPEGNLGEMEEDDYNQFRDKYKAEIEKEEAAKEEQRKADLHKQELKKKSGTARSEMLAEINVSLDANTCADMSEEVWKEYFESKNKEYQTEQNRLAIEKADYEKELNRRMGDMLEMGFDYQVKAKQFVLGHQTVEQFEVEDSKDWPATLKEFKLIAASEKKRLEDLQPDKAKAIMLIHSLAVTKYTKGVTFKTEAATKLMNDFITKAEALQNEYLELVETL